jgi:hypothetical protein
VNSNDTVEIPRGPWQSLLRVATHDMISRVDLPQYSAKFFPVFQLVVILGFQVLKFGVLTQARANFERFRTGADVEDALQNHD